MVGSLRQRMDPNERVYVKTKQGPKGKWRWIAYEVKTGAFVCLGPVLGFATQREALDHAAKYLNTSME